MDDLGRLELEFLSTIHTNHPYEPSGFLSMLCGFWRLVPPCPNTLQAWGGGNGTQLDVLSPPFLVETLNCIPGSGMDTCRWEMMMVMMITVMVMMMRMVFDMCRAVVRRHSLRRVAVEGCHQWRKSCADAVLLWGRGTMNIIAFTLPQSSTYCSVVLEVCGIWSYTMRYRLAAL